MRRVLATVTLLAASAATTSCSADEDPAGPSPDSGASPTKAIRTLTPLPMPPEPPPSGRLVADLRQSSRDAAANRFEVWIDNDTDRAIRPTRVSYSDGRFRSALPGTRLRAIPSRSERGFPIYQPDRPVCGSRATGGEVTVDYRTTGGGRDSVTVPVVDENDVAARYVASRCLELAVAQVAVLRWADDVPADGDGGQGSIGTLTLQVDPTGQPGHTLTIDSIRGTPLLTAAGSDSWQPALTVTGDMPATTVSLPVRPNRCDAHAFAESGGATAFAINLHLDGRAGQIILRMSPEGARNAFAFGLASCGSLT